MIILVYVCSIFSRSMVSLPSSCIRKAFFQTVLEIGQKSQTSQKHQIAGWPFVEALIHHGQLLVVDSLQGTTSNSHLLVNKHVLFFFSKKNIFHIKFTEQKKGSYVSFLFSASSLHEHFWPHFLRSSLQDFES